MTADHPASQDVDPPVNPFMVIFNCGSNARWTPKAAANGNVLVWSNDQVPATDKIAANLAIEIDANIWPALTDEPGYGLKMRVPKSDASRSFCNGGTGALDIYIGARIATPNETNVAGLWHPYVYGIETGVGTTGYILLALSNSATADKYTLAHEIFHSSQAAYEYDRATYHWLDEATAPWFEDFVYCDSPLPPALANEYIANTGKPLDEFKGTSEGAPWLYFYYLAGPKIEVADPKNPEQQRRVGQNAKLLRDIFEKAESSNKQPLQVLDEVKPLNTHWHAFARMNWNRPPVTKEGKRGYPDWNDIKPVPEARPWPERITCEISDGQYGDLLLVPVGLNHLSAKYYRIDQFTNARRLTWLGAPKGGESLKILAMINFDGKWTEEDWSYPLTYKQFCFDKPGEKITELVLVVSNSSMTLDFPRDWHGFTRVTRHMISHDGLVDYTITAEAEALFEPAPEGSPNAGKWILEDGKIHWHADGTFGPGTAVVGDVVRDLIPHPDGTPVINVNYGAIGVPGYDLGQVGGIGFDHQVTDPWAKATGPGVTIPLSTDPQFFRTGPNVFVTKDGRSFWDNYTETCGDLDRMITTWECSFIQGGPPEISATTSPPATESGYHRTDVDLKLENIIPAAHPPAPPRAVGSQAPTITYSASGAQPIPSTTVTDTSTTIRISADGETTVSYYATDANGNTGHLETLPVTIDKTPPTVIASTLQMADPQGWHQTDVMVRLDASDSGSGVKSVTYGASGAEAIPETVVAGGGPVVLTVTTDGTTTVTVTAIDTAGNESETHTATVNIAKPPSKDMQLCGEWRAWHEQATGKPTALHVTGTCCFPTSGWNAVLRRAHCQDPDPKALVLDVVVTPVTQESVGAEEPTQIQITWMEETDVLYDRILVRQGITKDKIVDVPRSIAGTAPPGHAAPADCSSTNY